MKKNKSNIVYLAITMAAIFVAVFALNSWLSDKSAAQNSVVIEPTPIATFQILTANPASAQPVTQLRAALPASAQSPTVAVITTAAATDTAEDKQTITVYVTKTGKKYHMAGCQYLSKSCIPIDLDDAKAGGYTPCSKCHPPK
jgi:hypothetical protein